MPNHISRILLAVTFAADKHRDQRRKDLEATPYVNHPLAVATVLATQGGVTNIDLLVAALLHDTVEDTATTLDELADSFGSEVRDIVSEVTDDRSLTKERRKQLQIESAPHKSESAKQLKIADKICNVRDVTTSSPVNWDRARKDQYLDWAELVIVGCRGVNEPLEQQFDEAISKARERLNL